MLLLKAPEACVCGRLSFYSVTIFQGILAKSVFVHSMIHALTSHTCRVVGVIAVSPAIPARHVLVDI